MSECRQVVCFNMDSPSKEVLEFEVEEVPASLLETAQRVNALQQVVEVFRGWSQDVAALKTSALNALAVSKENIAEINSLCESILNEHELAEEEKQRAKLLSRKSQFVLNNIPDRFNCLSSIGVPTTESAEIDGNSVQSNIKSVREQPLKCVLEVPYLTLDEFDSIPKYLKGRVTYDKINGFVDVFNKVLSNKYAIFKKKKSTLKKKDVNLWNEFNKQELKETKGLYFCVGNDFLNLASHALDKASLNMLTILRHLGRIREIRSGGILRYVAVY